MMQVARKAPRHRHNPVRGKPGCAGRVARNYVVSRVETEMMSTAAQHDTSGPSGKWRRSSRYRENPGRREGSEKFREAREKLQSRRVW